MILPIIRYARLGLLLMVIAGVGLLIAVGLMFDGQTKKPKP